MNTSVKNEVSRFSGNFKTIGKKIGAVCGLLFGLILLVTGASLSIFAYLAGINFDKIEVVLIVTSFVLFGLGAHCLDSLEAKKKS